MNNSTDGQRRTPQFGDFFVLGVAFAARFFATVALALAVILAILLIADQTFWPSGGYFAQYDTTTAVTLTMGVVVGVCGGVLERVGMTANLRRRTSFLTGWRSRTPSTRIAWFCTLAGLLAVVGMTGFAIIFDWTWDGHGGASFAGIWYFLAFAFALPVTSVMAGIWAALSVRSASSDFTTG